MKFRLIRSANEVTYKYYGKTGLRHSWENLNCRKMDIVEFKEYLRKTRPSDIIRTWRDASGSTETVVGVSNIGDNSYRIKFEDPFGNISYLDYTLPESIGKKDTPIDNSNVSDYNNENGKYLIIYDNKIEKSNISKKDVIEYYNKLISEYYDSLYTDLPEDEYEEAFNDGPKTTNDFKTAVEGLKELEYICIEVK